MIDELEESTPDCCECKYCESEEEDSYNCKYLRENKAFFYSDSLDTAENCKYYEVKETVKEK